MNNCSSEAERRGNAAAIGRWENEGGALGLASRGLQYGRRIEADRSWTIYHVFTGVPARFDGEAMVGLNRSDATKGMMHLNRRHATAGTSG